ncbi:MAG: metallophosphoesterase [Myxococcota bacterium]
MAATFDPRVRLKPHGPARETLEPSLQVAGPALPDGSWGVDGFTRGDVIVRPSVQFSTQGALAKTLPPYIPGKNYRIRIAHFNDSHGHFLADSAGGGLVEIARTIRRFRSEALANDTIFLALHAGDYMSGSPYSDRLKASPDRDVLNRIGLTAEVVGNHEFDHPLAVHLSHRRNAPHPILSSNVYNDRGDRVYAPSHLVNVNGLGIGIIGNTTESTREIGGHTEGLSFRSPVQESLREAKQLRPHAGLLINLSHLGYFEHREEKMSEDDYDVAQAGVFDLHIGGHTHLALHEPVYVNDQPIFQAGSRARHLGVIDLMFKDGSITHLDYRLLDVEKLRDHPAPRRLRDRMIARDAAAVWRQQEGELNRVVGSSLGRFEDRSSQNPGELPLQRLIAKCIRHETGADVAFHNRGNVRATIVPGPIRLVDASSVLIETELRVIELSAREFFELLDGIENKSDFGASGFQCTYGQNGSAKTVTLDGEPLTRESDRRVRVSMALFLAGGKGGMPKLPSARLENPEVTDLDVFVTRLQQGPIDPDNYRTPTWVSDVS